MRFILLLLICLLLSVEGTAQKKSSTAKKSTQTETVVIKHMPESNSPNFVFNRDCTFSASDGKAFVVYEAPGYSQRELYQSMLVGIAKLYKNPESVISNIEPNLITINAITSPCISYTKNNDLKEVTYTLQIQFKDGKIRIDAPVIGKYPKYNGWGDACEWIKFQNLYNKAKAGLEPELNNQIVQFLKSSFNPSEEW